MSVRYLAATLDEPDPALELLALALDDVAIALGGDGDRALGERFWRK